MQLLERLPHDLEKGFRNLFQGPVFGKIKTKLLLIPAKETTNMGSKEFDCPMTLLHKLNDLTAKCRSLSRKFYGEMTLFASAFAKPMKIRSFSLDKPIKCFAFLFTFCFYVYFSRTCESRSNSAQSRALASTLTQLFSVKRWRGSAEQAAKEPFTGRLWCLHYTEQGALVFG